LSGLVLGRRLLGAVLHSSDEPGELSQWLCHDDSTVNIVLDIIIIITITMTVVKGLRIFSIWYMIRLHSGKQQLLECIEAADGTKS